MRKSYGLERGNFLVSRDKPRAGVVVYSHSSIGAIGSLPRHLRDSLEAAIGVLEEEDGGPVVGEILSELTTCAGRQGREVVGWVHRDVEAE